MGENKNKSEILTSEDVIVKQEVTENNKHCTELPMEHSKK